MLKKDRQIIARANYNLKRDEEIARLADANKDMYEALSLFDCNIDFVNPTNPHADELLLVLTSNLREALAKATGKEY